MNEEKEYEENDEAIPHRRSIVVSNDNFDRLLDLMADVALPVALTLASRANSDNNQRFIPTLHSIMENDKMEHNDLLMITTFGFASKLFQLKMKWLQNIAMIKHLREFSKAQKFEDYIAKYLNSKETKEMLLQYVHQYDINVEKSKHPNESFYSYQPYH